MGSLMNLMQRVFYAILFLLMSTTLAWSADPARKQGTMFSKDFAARFPNCKAVIDIKGAPYFAQGDGVTDDTVAIQKALDDLMGTHRILYFPSGTYLISETLNWSKKNSKGEDSWGFNSIIGENPLNTIIRLKSGVFPAPMVPEPMMWCGGFGSADWFHNYVENVTFDVGDQNPAAIALQFYSNNTGAIRNCRFIATPSSGFIGIDLKHRDMNGPLLVKNCEVVGFDCAIATGHAVNSQTFECISIRNQRRIGFQNEGQSISIRHLSSINQVPAISTYGTLVLIDSDLTGAGEPKSSPAIVNFNGGSLFVRDVMTTGYARAIADIATPDFAAAFRVTGEDRPGSLGPNVVEYYSSPSTQSGTASNQSIRLTVKESPEVKWSSISEWANVDDYGADPTGGRDSSNAIQKAIDSGATTVFLPGHYQVSKTVIVRGNVERILGTGGWIDYNGTTKTDLRIIDGKAPVVSIEHFCDIGGGIEIDTARTVVLRSVGPRSLTCSTKSQGGELFLEDCVSNELQFKRQSVWARQLNVENEGTHILNDHSKLWVLGYKTERGGTLLESQNDGESEILGGFSYTTTAGKLAPMFHTLNSRVFAFFNEVCFNNDPYETIIEERQGANKRIVKRGEGDAKPYVSGRQASN